MLKRPFYTPKPLDEPAHTRTALSYSQEELALLIYKAFAIQYRVEHGHWPTPIEREADGGLVVRL